MAFRKAIGITVFAVQTVVSADYLIQTRDAGLGWGELSGADYVAIVQARFADGVAAPRTVAELASGAPSAGQAVSDGGSGGDAPGICVRRGTALQCN